MKTEEGGTALATALDELREQKQIISDLSRKVELLSGEVELLKRMHASKSSSGSSQKGSEQKKSESLKEQSARDESQGKMSKILPEGIRCKKCSELIEGNPIDLPLSMNCPNCKSLVLNYIS